MIDTIKSLIINHKKITIVIVVLALFGSKQLIAGDTDANQAECNIMLDDAKTAKQKYESLDFKNEDLNKALDIYGYDKVVDKIKGKMGSDCSLKE